MKPFVSLMVFVLILFSCNDSKRAPETAAPPKPEEKGFTKLENMNWLLGSWGNTSNEGILVENWEKFNDSVYKGESFFIVQKDTVFAEYIDLAEANGKLTYTVSVRGQNDEQPVPFTMTSGDDKTTVFENPEHDFPNKIIYSKVGNDSLVATISGIQKDKPVQQIFKMKKLK